MPEREMEMSQAPEWRRKALALFPDLREDLEDPDANIYTVLFELLPRCEQAHKDNDVRSELSRIYEYAEWCFHKDYEGREDLGNAVGVAFYEHLVDEPETLAAIPQWVKPEIFNAVSGLFEWRLGEAGFQQLKEVYDRSHQPKG